MEKQENYQDIKIFTHEAENVRGEMRYYARFMKARARKPFANYYFKTAEKRAEYIQEMKEAADRRIAAKEERKKARQNFINPYKEGDILYSSWGYDQTNVDFYQVIKTTAKTIEVRKIGSEMVEGSEGFMSCKVKPVKDNFIGEETERKRLKKSGNEVIAGSGFESLSKYEGEGRYCSWYA